MKTDQVKLLLEKVEFVGWKYAEILRDPRFGFNIFSMLRQGDDEVNLHSRFLYELLNPKGTHSQGDRFLHLFLKQVDIADFDSTSAYVRQEYWNIDILIANENQAIIIENKIHAGDQDRQLERYHSIIKREGFKNISMVYLTLYGDNPSDQSLGTLRDREDNLVRCISYKDDVHEWLEECINSASRYPVVRETIVQYQRLIERLTGQSLSKGYIMDVKELLIDEKNIELATSISHALVEARIDIQFAFWRELENRLRREGFKIADGQPYYNKYSRAKVEKYHRKNKRYYGVMIELRNLETNTQLLFYTQVDWNIYYGFVVIRGETRKIAQESQFDQLAAIVKEIDDSFKRTEYWIGWRFPKRKFDFKNFNDPNVFALANPTKCTEYVGELVNEMKGVITQFNDLYDQEAQSRK